MTNEGRRTPALIEVFNRSDNGLSLGLGPGVDKGFLEDPKSYTGPGDRSLRFSIGTGKGRG